MKKPLAVFAAVVAVALSVSAAAGQAPPDSGTTRWTPELLGQYRPVLGVALSPAGEHAAYVLGVIYPRTGHAPDEPKFVIDLSYRILRWFERHLGRRDAVTSGDS